MTTAAADPDRRCEVLVIGGGPAGATTASVLAACGHEVVLVDPGMPMRPEGCAETLSPVAIHALSSCGITAAELDRFHRVEGIRLIGHHRHRDRAIEIAWPAHPTLVDHGYVVSRDALDRLMLDTAIANGAALLDGYEATEPILERGFVRGAVLTGRTREAIRMHARFTVIADGANSRFGRSLGTHRERSWPYSTAIRSVWSTPRHADPHIEIVAGLRGTDDRPLTGYGWVFPAGDGTATIGVGVISTSAEFASVNTVHLLSNLAEALAERWELDPHHPRHRPMSGRIPLGGSVGPTAGPAHLVVGDAAGLANPFSGAGIESAVTSGRLAGEILASALDRDDPTELQRYPRMLADAYESYFKVGRLADRVLGRPAILDRATDALLRSQRVAAATTRIALGELRPRHPGVPETVVRIARALSVIAPSA